MNVFFQVANVFISNNCASDKWIVFLPLIS